MLYIDCQYTGDLRFMSTIDTQRCLQDIFLTGKQTKLVFQNAAQKDYGT